jgi:hypothetical protein
MGAGKEMWMAEIESILDQFDAEKLTEDEATKELIRLGFDKHEALEMLHPT